MRLTFEPVTLESPFGDGDGRLVLLHGKLRGVLSRLGTLHGELEGRWFIEAWFADDVERTTVTFEHLEQFEEWAESVLIR